LKCKGRIIVAREQGYPFILSGTFSREANDGFNVAGGEGTVITSKMLRSAGDLWLWYHRSFMQQGYPPVEATRHLIEQTKKLAQPQPQPQAAPFPTPSMSPFAQPPMNGAPRANP
jgi:hypothetical protein